MNFQKQAEAAKDYIIEKRRLFHRFPEPSTKEFKTHALIREALNEMKISYLAPADNITIAVLGEGRPVVGLRCDTDALQQTEETGLPYASEHPGLMHACGHDAHIACGLGVLKILQGTPFKGTVKLIFQPAEEGGLGAQAVLATHTVDDVEAFFALHVWSPYETGTLHVSTGGVAASCDMFTLRIRGKSGHGALPHQCVDAVACGCNLVQNLQYIASRFTSPMDPVVVTVGSFHAGTRCNIIAGEAVLEGTLRTFSPETYKKLHEQFDRIIENTCSSFGCTWDIDMVPACSVTWNDEKLAGIAREAARELTGKDALPDEKCMLADDIAEYRAIAPICYVKAGIGNPEKDSCHPHHSNHFKIDEDALPTAVAWLCGMMEKTAEQLGK